jgi:hypothetical protein
VISLPGEVKEIGKDEFRCALCNRIFKKGRSDDIALEEFTSLFGKGENKDKELVCEDCFNMMTFMYPVKQYMEDTKDEKEKEVGNRYERRRRMKKR